jgi:hypothetical protein
MNPFYSRSPIEIHILDGFVKSPSVPLGAGLRGNLVVAAPKGPHSSVFARLASEAFYETIVPVNFYRVIILNAHFSRGLGLLLFALLKGN